MTTPFDRRLEACQRGLERVGADLAVCFPSPNLTYLTGFAESPSERHLLLFVPKHGDPVVVAPAMYDAQLEGIPVAQSALEVRLYGDTDDPVAIIDDVLETVLGDRKETRKSPDRASSTGAPTILVDDRLWATFTQDLRACRPDATYGLVSEILTDLRIRKEPVELDALRRAGSIADRVSLEIRRRGDNLVGRTESELAAEIERQLTAYGGAEPAFETVVASGPNGARPHHHTGDREIEPGDPIVLDFGAFVDADLEGGAGRYPGDQTRTMVVGDPSSKYRRVHEIVREAQRAAVETVEPGVTAGEIDRAARAVIEAAGYGEAFVHRTGHGVGLEVHEPPYIVADNDRELEPGMVFSVEPGIYLEGQFGVRIEDLVVVTEDGAECLNDSPRGWATGADGLE